MEYGELAAVLDGLKSSSKGIGSHKGRQLYWEAYGQMIARVSSMEGTAHCFLRFLAVPGKEAAGELEVVDLTKRQKGLLSGPCDLMGKKLKAPDNPAAKSWCMSWGEEEAQIAWDDITHAEPCIYVSGDAVYVATRYKRALCKGISGPPKSVKDAEALVAELAPDKPLRSVAWVGNDPPAVSGYNTFLTGACKFAKDLPASIGYVNATSTSEIYDYFLQRRNAHLIAEAGKLIGQMLADVGKGLVPIISASSTKEAAIAYKNALMRRVYVHESFGKFVDRVRKDGSVELWVITGDVDDTEFGRYGKIVFELFYRMDLSIMG